MGTVGKVGTHPTTLYFKAYVSHCSMSLGEMHRGNRWAMLCDAPCPHPPTHAPTSSRLQINVTLREEYRLSRDVADHLVSNYGTRALQIAEIVRRYKSYAHSTSDARRLSRKYPFLEAEVVFAVEQEYALKAVDVLARRTRIAFIDCKAAGEAAPRVVEIMAGLLGWSKIRKEEELKEVRSFLETMSPDTGGPRKPLRSRKSQITT
ncbi:unnamed protein product [Discosporangium mesarthrocarpum]